MARSDSFTRSPIALLSLILIGTFLGKGHAAGTGPPADISLVAAPFEQDGRPDQVFVAWRGPQSSIEAGLLDLEDGTFTGFPSHPLGYLTNLNVGVGGPPNERRAYVVWVSAQMNLMMLVFDANGAVVGPPHAVANSVQVVPIRIAGTDQGAQLAYSWGANPYWDPRILTVGGTGTPSRRESLPSSCWPCRSASRTAVPTSASPTPPWRPGP